MSSAAFLAQSLNQALVHDPFGKPFTPSSLTDLLKKPNEDSDLVNFFDRLAHDANCVISAYHPITKMSAVIDFIKTNKIYDGCEAITTDVGMRFDIVEGLVSEIAARRVALAGASSSTSTTDASPTGWATSQLLFQLLHTLQIDRKQQEFTTARALFWELGSEISLLASSVPPGDLKPVLKDIMDRSLNDKEKEMLQGIAPLMTANYTSRKKGMLTRFQVLMVAMTDADKLTAFQQLLCKSRTAGLLDHWKAVIDTTASISTSTVLERVSLLAPLHIHALYDLSGRSNAVQRSLLRFMHRD
eukprot:PhF_6_TR29137/c0_g1_i2/m.42559